MKTLIEVEHEQGSAEQVVAYIRKMSGARIRILPQAKPAEGSHPDEDKLSLNGECGVSKRREGVVAPVADLHEFTDSIKEVASWLENNHYLTMAAKLRTALVMIAAMQKLADEEPARFEAWFRERVSDRVGVQQIFDAIKHGDMEHQAWLYSKLTEVLSASQSAASAVPDGYVLIEKTFIPTDVHAAGVAALDLCKRQGYDDSITISVIFDSMILKADQLGYAPLNHSSDVGE